MKLKQGWLCTLALVCVAVHAAAGQLYMDPTVSVPQRVQDLLSQMTLAEKIGQMTQPDRQYVYDKGDIAKYFLGSLLSGGGSVPPAGNEPSKWADMVDDFQKTALTTRLKIPIIYGIDAVHGHNNVIGATIFPHNIGLGATRDAALAKQIGRAVAEEVAGTGIKWTFAPTLAVVRDERWGRTYEGFGEDPEVVTLMSAMISGFQGTLNSSSSIAATAKHYVGDGGTTGGKDQGNTEVTEAVLRAIHLPAYLEAIKQNVQTAMISYSSWNGVKMHGNKYLITDVLKKELGFAGLVVSDWAGVNQITGDYTAAVRTAINAGIDMVMVPDNYIQFISILTSEVQNGNVPQSRIDDAVTRILTVKFNLGIFDKPYTDRTLTPTVGSAQHRDVARKAVAESLVLLKNDGVLPLRTDYKKVFVAGRNANNLGNQCGGWTITWQGQSGNTTKGTTILEAIKASLSSSTEVTFMEYVGGQLTADVGIVVVGETPYAEGMGDKQDLSLAYDDISAINTVCKAMPCVVVLVSGRPMIITDQLASANAFVAAWLPGTEGAGVTDVLFGKTDFVGKLPCSWPKSMAQIPINKGDATYDPLFAYGFGLTMGKGSSAPKPVQPTGSVKGPTPSFQWTPVTGAQWYYVMVYDTSKAAYVVNEFVASSACGTTCSKTFATGLTSNFHYWIVIANKDSSWSNWSDWASFTVTA